LKFLTLIVILIALISSILYSSNKNNVAQKAILENTEYDEIVMGFGSLQNYVTNNIYASTSSFTWETFLFGRAQLDFPSMMWSEGGYESNHYLYSGAFFIGYNNNFIRFDTKTSNDFKVDENNPQNRSPFTVSFSMTDDSASTYKVGVKCICMVHVWPEPNRDDFLVYEYLIINNSGSILQDVYTGLFMDCDVSSEGGTCNSYDFNRDDLVDYCLGKDKNNHPESISYMYDGDSPNCSGDDTGGRYNPKESLGYIGSRIIECPSTKHGVPANQQSGHMWGSWGFGIGPGYPQDEQTYQLMSREKFELPPSYTHDFNYYQTCGPWDIQIMDTLRISFALGIGKGLQGMRDNLQIAYDTYWGLGSLLNSMPYITDYYPYEDTLVIYSGDIIIFFVSTFDKEDDEVITTWKLNEMYSNKRDSCYAFNSTSYPLGINNVSVEVTDNQYTNVKSWIVDVKPAKKYELAQNYPNPFNGFTTIPFELQKDGNVNITIYDVLGRKVKTLINKPYTFGKHSISWAGTDANSQNVSSGIYLYRIKSNNYSKTKRLLLLR
jgi:type IX secretion system substrate protein